VTNLKSWSNVRNWVRNIHDNTPQTVNKILIGNKCDLSAQRQVTTAQGEQLAREYSMKFLETSARANTGVTDAFLTVSTDVVERLLANGDTTSPGGVNINSPPAVQSGKCNC